MMKSFYETREMFRNYIGYTKPLSYEEWLSLPDDHKAAALYVQFFNEILLAWNKAKSYDGDDEEAVETVLQYLIKNTSIIMNDCKRYTAKYIYRISYNCLYCICHDRKRDKDRREFEVYAIQTNSSGEEFNLMDCCITQTKDAVINEINKQKFWALVERLDSSSLDIIEHILETGVIPDVVGDEQLAHIKSKLTKIVSLCY